MIQRVWTYLKFTFGVHLPSPSNPSPPSHEKLLLAHWCVTFPCSPKHMTCSLAWDVTSSSMFILRTRYNLQWIIRRSSITGRTVFDPNLHSNNLRSNMEIKTPLVDFLLGKYSEFFMSNSMLLAILIMHNHKTSNEWNQVCYKK